MAGWKGLAYAEKLASIGPEELRRSALGNH